MHLLEQYFRSSENFLPQAGHIFNLRCLFGNFLLLTIAAQDFEQKQIPEEGISLDFLLKVLLQLGLPHLKVPCLFLAELWHSKEQYCFHPCFLA